MVSDPYQHDPNDPWWIPGWTVQNATFTSPGTTPPDAPYPADIPMVNVIATYMDDEGNPVDSSLLVRPNATYRDAASGTTVMPRVRRYRFNGKLDIQLPSSDSAALETTFTYTVREGFSGGRQFAINVPAAKSGTGPVELHSLIVDDANIVPIDSVPPMHGWLHYPATY